MIRSIHPIEVWLKKQTPSYRLAFRRMGYAGDILRKPSCYTCDRNNKLLRDLETNAMTPLLPGEKMH